MKRCLLIGVCVAWGLVGQADASLFGRGSCSGTLSYVPATQAPGPYVAYQPSIAPTLPPDQAQAPAPAPEPPKATVRTETYQEPELHAVTTYVPQTHWETQMVTKTREVVDQPVSYAYAAPVQLACCQRKGLLAGAAERMSGLFHRHKCCNPTPAPATVAVVPVPTAVPVPVKVRYHKREVIRTDSF